MADRRPPPESEVAGAAPSGTAAIEPRATLRAHCVAEAKPVGIRRCPATVGPRLGCPRSPRFRWTSQAALRDARLNVPRGWGAVAGSAGFAPSNGDVPDGRADARKGAPMGRTLRRVLVSGCLVLAVPIGSVGAASAAPIDRAELAAGYLRTQQLADGSFPAFSAVGSTADAVLALTAARVGGATMRDALRFLQRQVRGRGRGRHRAAGQGRDGVRGSGPAHRPDRR